LLSNLQDYKQNVKNYGRHKSLRIPAAHGHGSERSANRAIHILYDGSCPICCRKVAFLKRRDHAGKIFFSDIRSTENLSEPTGLPKEQLEKQIHAILPDGTGISRMAVIRAAYWEVDLGWVAAPTGWPVLRPLFDRLYDFVAKYRQTISRLWR
jgi:predicted DCC family thiol-disulfide oxidoreductase YuxK